MRLTTAASLFVAANVLHSLDHARQGFGHLTIEVIAAGSLLTLAGVLALVLALRADPRAVAVCLAVGASGALGVASAHLAPHWSAFSDPYADRSLDVLSWGVMLAELAAAALLAAVGARMLPGRGGRTA
jgi:hypothetical protein